VNSATLTKAVVGRLLKSPTFFNVYGPQLRKLGKFSDSGMQKLLTVLDTYRRNGATITSENFRSVLPADILRVITGIGVSDDTTLDDETLVSLYLRSQMSAVLNRLTIDVQVNNDYFGKKWTTLIDAFSTASKISEKTLTSDMYGGEAYLTQSVQQVYNEAAAMAAERASGRGYTSGIQVLDECKIIPRRRDIFLVIGHMNSGKSYFLDNIAVKNAERGHVVIVYTLEMPHIDRLMRIEQMLTTSVQDSVDLVYGVGQHEIVSRKTNWSLPRHALRRRAVEDYSGFIKLKGAVEGKSFLGVTGSMVNDDGTVNQDVRKLSELSRIPFLESGGDVFVKAGTIGETTIADVAETIQNVRATGREVSMVILDYSALMSSGNRDLDQNYNDRLSKVSLQFKDLVQKFNIAGVNCHQANDEATSVTKKAGFGGQQQQKQASVYSVCGIKLLRPIIATNHIFGAKSLANDAALAIGLNTTNPPGDGLVINELRSRNSGRNQSMWFLKLGLPAKYVIYANTIYPYEEKEDGDGK